MDSESVRSGKKRVSQDEDEVSSSLEVDSQSFKKQHNSSSVPTSKTPVYVAPAWDDSWVIGKAPLSYSSGVYGRSTTAEEAGQSIIVEKAPLSPAISEENIVLAKASMNDDVYMNDVPTDGQSPISSAALQGDFKTVRLLLDAGVVANEEECHTISTHLARAVDRGDSEAPWLLADGRADVSLRLRVGSFGSPLALATAFWSQGTATTVEILLEAGADVNMQLTSGEYGSALAAACAARRLSNVKLLLRRGADINLQLKSGRYGSALAAACADWSPMITKLIAFLLEAGADVDMQLMFGEFGSALAAACAAGRLSNVKLLLQRGADINLQLKSGRYGSALAAACSAGQITAVEFLFEKGALVDAQLTSGIYGSALAAACLSVSPGNTDVIDILLEAGADIDLQLTSGEHGSALSAACAARSASTVKYLLKKGADINLQLTSGRYGSALTNAIARERLDYIGLLLDRGADASLPLLSGEFGDAMAFAFDSENLDAIKLLLQAGASIGPLAEALIRQPPQSGTQFVKNFEAIRMNFNTFEARYLRETYLWYPPTTMSAIQDKSTWLFDFGALIRTAYTVEFDALGRLIERFYGDMGLRVLQGLVRAISHHGKYIDRYMRLKVSPMNLEEKMLDSKSLLVSLETTSCTPEIPDAMLLICRVIRAPSPGLVCISTSNLDGETVILNELLPVPSASEITNCWYGLFDSAVIGLQRDVDQGKPCRGLVLDFKILLSLSAVEYPLLVDSGTILMGYSTALIPICETEDGMILWHLEIAEDDFQLKVADLEATRHDWLQTQSLDYLQSKKALLGWCSKAHILLGTDRLAPEVTWSAARNKPVTWNWKGANLQATFQTASPVQIGLQAGGSFERMSNRLRFDPSAMYLKCLRSSMFEQVIVYDVSAKRAWLVPLLSVLHHMLLVYVHSMEQESLFSIMPVANCRFGGPLDSLKALQDKGDMVIEGSGSHTLTVAQLIMKFSVNMSRLSPQKPKRSTIYGYEFMDIVMDSTRSELKKETLEKDGLAWLSLLDEVNCLFCSGMGEAIIGDRALDISSACNRLPKGNDFLAASMKSVEIMSKRHGGSHQMDFCRLSQKHSWQLTGSPFKKCAHANDAVSCWQCPEFLQEIQNRQCSSQVNDQRIDNCAHGALVFGSLVHSRSMKQPSATLAILPRN